MQTPSVDRCQPRCVTNPLSVSLSSLRASCKALLSVSGQAKLVFTVDHCTAETAALGHYMLTSLLPLKSRFNVTFSKRIFSITQSEIYHQLLSVISAKQAFITIYHYLTFFFFFFFCFLPLFFCQNVDHEKRNMVSFI